mgnify:CR=1 FL=1
MASRIQNFFISMCLSSLFLVFTSCEKNELFIHCDRIEWYLDEDEDGYGDPNRVTTSCQLPLGYVDNDGDCDDTNPSIFEPINWYIDADDDGLGDATNSILSCRQPFGYVPNRRDDDDTVNEGEVLEEDFNEHFYGTQWLCDDYYEIAGKLTHYSLMFGLISENSTIEGINMEVGEKLSGSLSYEREFDRIKIESPIFEDLFTHSELPLYITYVNGNSMRLEDSSGKKYEFHNKPAISGCKFERLINADWLVFQSTINGDENCVRFDSIRINNEIDIAGLPSNLFGSIASPEHPDGVPPTIAQGSNDIVAVNGCTNMYSTFPDLIYFNHCGSQIFDFDEIVIQGDILKCGGYEFLIVD